jgi:predicted NodU family carbamoyl transferase
MDLDRILADYGWEPETIDMVVINPWVRPTLDGKWWQWELQGDTYLKYPDYMLDGWKGAPEGRYSQHQIRLFGRWYDGYAVDHHLAHVAGALFASPFEEAGILTADGGGDSNTAGATNTRKCSLTSDLSGPPSVNTISV